MRRKKTMIIISLLVIGLLGLWALSSPFSDSKGKQVEVSTGTRQKEKSRQEEDCPLQLDHSMKLDYAENFQVDYYKEGYKMLTTIMDGKRFLLVPEGKPIPKGLDKEVVVLQTPLQNIYLVASAVMDMFAKLDGLDAITFSGQKEENWYIPEAKAAMEAGKMQYAGKYNKPDYEQLVAKNCSLAIENMMISHAPEVVEKMEEFDIPVLIEYSSYETHPMGRVEWVKFFGALLGKEEEAERIFQQQVGILDRMEQAEKSDQTVAFFFVTSNGLIKVRQSNDYVPKMIQLAGGRYIFENLGDPGTRRSTVNMQVEEFYNGAKDAYYLIYNSSIDGGVMNLEELLAKCNVLSDFKAVKEGNVWCTTNDMYQQSLSIGYLVEDMHQMMSGEDESKMNYLFHLE